MVSSNAKMKNTALNAKLKRDGGFERQTKDDMMILNAKLWRDGSSECQTKSNSYECQAKTTTLNAKLNW